MGKKEENYLAWRPYKDRSADVGAAGEGLKKFLTACKTEREATSRLEELFLAAGYRPLDKCDGIAPGDGVYMNWRGRAFMAFRAGALPVWDGFRLVGAHADSPRIDIKCKPLYEDSNLLMADAHYYGGIKKYQWTNIPTALHGEINRKDGTTLRVSIGEDASEPLLLIPDLAPHLDRKLSERKADETIKGEDLDAIFAHRPDLAKSGDGEKDEKDERGDKEPLLATLLAWIEKNWGIDEDELAAAELSLVPAGPARDAGLDGAMVASYGIDDRACVWAAAEAMLGIGSPTKRGAVFLSTDREEIGSDGVAGAHGKWLELFVLELLERSGCKNGALGLRRAYAASEALSADVTEAANPLYKDAFDPRQMPLAGNGAAMMRATGSGGKYGASEARGAFVARVIDCMSKNGVPWQVGSLGKVDQGGGGTIAMFLAELGMDVVDLGPAVVSLHSPWELVSKADLLAAKEAYSAFYMGA